MSNETQGTIHATSEGGVAGTHPKPDPLQLLVAPSTSSELNTARLRLIPVACWQVENIRFAFDSSFVTSEIQTELQHLASLRSDHQKTDPATGKPAFPPISIFGHADPVGRGSQEQKDEYNRALSGRRATVIYALLISNTNPEKAISLWKNVAGQESWGTNQRREMQTATGLPAGTPDTQLFVAYMRMLCPAELNLTPEDFLAHGKDGQGKGDYQGCSSFNLRVILSQKQEDEYQKAERDQDESEIKAHNKANEQNRRVIVLLFRPGSRVDPAKWPCPRATEGVSGCKKRFWSDAEKRRTARLPDQDRRFDITKDTFACRFFQRISDSSPCNRTTQQPICVVADLNGLTAQDFVLSVEQSGQTIFRIEGTSAQQRDGLLVWVLHPEFLPSPTEVVLISRGERTYLGQAFNGCALRDALQSQNLGPTFLTHGPVALGHQAAQPKEHASAFTIWDPRTITS
jgi:hypothetical protein